MKRVCLMTGVAILLSWARPASAAVATGGTVTNYTMNGTNFTAHMFTAAGSTNLTVLNTVNLEVLVVGGGGGGGQTIGGGGGAGGFVYSNVFAASPGTYAITVGTGGVGAAASTGGFPTDGGAKGGNSAFDVLTAFGGGGGGSYNNTTTYNSDGASGGGRGAGSTSVTAAAYLLGQGRAGGTAGTNTNSGAGGGGAGGAGGNATSGVEGAGGAGMISELSGVSFFYAGGGGGGARNPNGGNGGAGGSSVGGAGSRTNGFSALVNSGSGGGGGGYLNSPATSYAGGNGGSGIVIVRYFDPAMPRLLMNPVSNVTLATVDLSGTLSATGASPTTVYAFWSTNDCTTNMDAWLSIGNSTNLGERLTGDAFMVTPGNLQAYTRYYVNIAASNEAGVAWAHITGSPTFVTLSGPTVNNGNGASAVLDLSAVLNGSLIVSGTARSYFLWGPSETSLANTNDLGFRPEGALSQTVTGLTAATPYYYQVYASNAYGEAWSPVTNFTSLNPKMCTWTSAVAGYWTNAANWIGGVPGPADEARFTNGSTSVTISGPVEIGKLTVTNCTRSLIFTQDVPGNLIVHYDLYLGSGASFTVNRSSTVGNGTGRVITVGGDAAIIGSINGNGKGFNANSGPGAGLNNVRGASHGGRGGKDAAYATYGSLTEPTSLGSGGTTLGGGAVKLEVGGTLTVAGSITMRGETGHDASAGGSIWLVANQLAGAGTLDASGGNCANPNEDHPGGGGGRISLQYTNSSFSGLVTAAGGLGGRDGADKVYLHAQPGTLWEPGRLPSSGSLTITGGSYQYWFPAGSTQNWDTLTVANLDQSGMLFLHNGAFIIRDLTVSNAMLRFDIGDTGGMVANIMAIDALAVTGSLSVVSKSSAAADAGYLYLPSRGAYTLAGNFTCGSNTVVFPQPDLTAINPASGGTVSIPHGSGLVVKSANATVDGMINGDYQGFGYNAGPGAGSYNGYGATHGGMGSWGASTTVKAPYGLATQPTALGSGAGNAAGANAGGGAVRIEVANSLSVNGAISVNGLDDHEGSSGGSIWLSAQTFSGIGSLSANGGNSGSMTFGYGAGGGGRIAIQATNTTFSGSVSAAAGLGVYYAQPGTLWQPGRFAATNEVTMTTGYQYMFEPGTTQVFDRLVIANPAKGGAVCFSGGSLRIGQLVVSNASLRFDVATNGATGLFKLESLTVTGSVTVAAAGTANTEIGSLYLPAEGVYNLSGDFICKSNAIVYPLGNTAATNSDSGGTGAVRHGAGPVINAANAVIDGSLAANGLGFTPGQGPASGLYNGYAASHGGRGGNASKATYGSLSRPSALGSGSGNGGTTGNGGGAVKLAVTNSLIVNGSILVSGPAAYSGGSGGSLHLKARTLSGIGVLRADGGDGVSTTHSGGGGGRIALEYSSFGFSGIISAKGGAYGSPASATGTWFYCQSPLDDRGIGLRSDYDVASHAQGVKITRTVTKWMPKSMAWTERSTQWSGADVSNRVAYTLSGVDPNARFQVSDNGVFKTNVISSAQGIAGPFWLVLAATGEHAITVQGPSGTMIMIR